MTPPYSLFVVVYRNMIKVEKTSSILFLSIKRYKPVVKIIFNLRISITLL